MYQNFLSVIPCTFKKICGVLKVFSVSCLCVSIHPSDSKAQCKSENWHFQNFHNFKRKEVEYSRLFLVKELMWNFVKSLCLKKNKLISWHIANRVENLANDLFPVFKNNMEATSMKLSKVTAAVKKLIENQDKARTKLAAP